MDTGKQMTPLAIFIFISWGYLAVFDGTGKIEEYYDNKYQEYEAKFKKHD